MKQLKADLWMKWQGLVLEQSQSGQTVSAFCRDRGIRDSQFYDWKKRVREGEAAKGRAAPYRSAIHADVEIGMR